MAGKAPPPKERKERSEEDEVSRSEMPRLICSKVMKRTYLPPPPAPFKSTCPADVCEIHVSSFIFCENILPEGNVGDNFFFFLSLAGLKMYMQMRATLEHAQVVNKLTRGRNNSV